MNVSQQDKKMITATIRRGWDHQDFLERLQIIWQTTITLAN